MAARKQSPRERETVRPGEPRGVTPAGGQAARVFGPSRWLDRLGAWLVVGGVLAGVLLFYPFGRTFEFNPDEGIELMKALLVSRGYELYDQVWNDQPPLATYVLAGWLRWFGWSVFAGRCLVLLASSVLLWSLYQVVRMSWGHVHALLAVVAMLLSAHFLPRCVSVMFIIPMHAFLLLSLYGLWRFRGGVWGFPLVLSAVAMALSVHTKFASAFLVPLMWLGVAAIGWSNRAAEGLRRAVVWPVLAWTGVFGAVSVVLLLALVAPHNLSKLVAPHAAAGVDPSLKGGPKVLWEMIQQDIQFVPLAAAGAMLALVRKRWRSLLAVGWYGLALAVLVRHRPLWHHYYLFLSIPVCWLAGIAGGELFVAPTRSNWLPGRLGVSSLSVVLRWVVVGLVIVAVPALPAKWKRLSDALANAKDARDRTVVERMKSLASPTQWVFTDRQIVPFYAGLLVPPELSVTSLKRLRAGDLTRTRVLELMKRYEPEQAFFDGERIPLFPELKAYLAEHYVWQGKDMRALYFVKRGLP